MKIQKNICYKYSSLGNCYKKQYVTDKPENYIITYNVESLNVQNAYLIYADTFDDNYKVKLLMKEAYN